MMVIVLSVEGEQPNRDHTARQGIQCRLVDKVAKVVGFSLGELGRNLHRVFRVPQLDLLRIEGRQQRRQFAFRQRPRFNVKNDGFHVVVFGYRQLALAQIPLSSSIEDLSPLGRGERNLA